MSSASRTLGCWTLRAKAVAKASRSVIRLEVLAKLVGLNLSKKTNKCENGNELRNARSSADRPSSGFKPALAACAALALLATLSATAITPRTDEPVPEPAVPELSIAD